MLVCWSFHSNFASDRPSGQMVRCVVASPGTSLNRHRICLRSSVQACYLAPGSTRPQDARESMSPMEKLHALQRLDRVHWTFYDSGLLVHNLLMNLLGLESHISLSLSLSQCSPMSFIDKRLPGKAGGFTYGCVVLIH